MINKNELYKVGIDYAAGMERFMNDAELYEAILTAFAEAKELKLAQSAFKENDMVRLMNAVHTAKGSCGNAGLNSIYKVAGELVTLLRSGSYSQSEFAEKFKNFEVTYIKTQNAVKLALGL